MNAWKVILSTLVIFGAGVITGGLLVSYAIHSNISPIPITQAAAPATQTALNPLQLRVQLLKRMVRDLDLTTGQREHIEQIIKDSQERTKEIYKPVAGPMNKEMKRVVRELREQLTTEQQQRFDELMKSHPGLERRKQGFNTGTSNAPAP